MAVSQCPVDLRLVDPLVARESVPASEAAIHTLEGEGRGMNGSGMKAGGVRFPPLRCIPLVFEDFLGRLGGKTERQRRSIFQPGVGAYAYPGFAKEIPPNLKGLCSFREPFGCNPVRVAIPFLLNPKVAFGATLG
jgi:hypothetical protein